MAEYLGGEEQAVEHPVRPPSASWRTIQVEGRRPDVFAPADVRREAEAGPSMAAPVREGPAAVAPAVGGPPVIGAAQPAAEAAAPAGGPQVEKKKAKRKPLGERFGGGGGGKKWGHIGGVLLRFLQLAAFCVSFSVIAASGDNGLLFSDFQAFTFLVAATVIGATWTLCMLLNELGKLLGPATRQWLITLLDVAILLLVYGASCASAALTTFSDKGAPPAYPRGLCQTGIFSKFCSRTKASVAFGFIGFGFLLPSVIWSFYSTARRYVANRGEREGRR